MALELNPDVSREIQLARHYYEKGILPDENPDFVKKIIETIDKHSMGLWQYSIAYNNMKFNTERAKKIERKINSRWLDQYEKIVERFFDHYDYLETKGISSALISDVKKKKDDAIKYCQRAAAQLKGLSEKRVLDRTVMAALIWDLKHLIEEEITRRNNSRPKLRLTPPPGKRNVTYPSYRNQWELISKILNDHFERDPHFISFPFSKEAIRRFAYRHKK